MLTGVPFIPETITVHLGKPDTDAENVTVSFPEYIKNVASSEIYPTWPENALRANIYVIISYVLNRIYTEWYRARGYHFDVTNSTQYDQAFVYGREIFENISHLVDELFFTYIRRENAVEPLFAAFCDGVATTCAGLSQWGTVELARQGYTPFEILQHYYGDDILLVKSEDIRPAVPTYPNAVLREGEFGRDVQTIQTQLNRISRNFPEIPKLAEIDGIYDAKVAEAVRVFQRIFNLPQTGEVDESTWYQLSYIYTSVKRLADLQSEGLRIEEITRDFPEVLKEGDSGLNVRTFQYYLAVVGAYYASVIPIVITGDYDSETAAAVESFQQTFGLPQTGIMDRRTWNDLYAAYAGILESQPAEVCARLYPNQVLREGVSSENVRLLQQYLTFISQYDKAVPAVSDTGYFGPLTKAAVQAFQREYGLNVTGIVGAVTWDVISGTYAELKCGSGKRPYQAPGYTIR